MKKGIPQKNGNEEKAKDCMKCRWLACGCELGFKIDLTKSKTRVSWSSTTDYDFYGARQGVTHHKVKTEIPYIPQPLGCIKDGTMKKIEKIIDDIRAKNKY